MTTEATVKVHVGGERDIATAEGNGPVNALDRALRSALNGRFPALERVHLTDYKVRVLDTNKGTGAVTRVLIDSTDGDADVDHDRREREHHRGVVAGAARLDPLRPAARARRRPAGLRLAFRACRPIRSCPPTPTIGPASSRTCRRASRCRRPAGGGRTAPGDLGGSEAARGRAARPPGPERRLRLHARRARRRPARARARPKHADDVIAVIAEIAGKRAALFGRAPVIGDVDVAIGAARLRRQRRRRVRRRRARCSCTKPAHDYRRRRALVDAVPDALLRRKPDEVGAEIDEWRARGTSTPASAELRRQPTM